MSPNIIEVLSVLSVIASTWIGLINSNDVIMKNEDITGWRIILAIIGLPGTVVGLILLLIAVAFIALIAGLAGLSFLFNNINIFSKINEVLSRPLFIRNKKRSRGIAQ